MDHDIIYAVVGITLWENYYECEFCFKLYKKKDDAEAEAKRLNDIIAKLPKLEADEKHIVISPKEVVDKYHELKDAYRSLLMEEIYKGNVTLGDIDYVPMEWTVKEVKLFS